MALPLMACSPSVKEVSRARGPDGYDLVVAVEQVNATVSTP